MDIFTVEKHPDADGLYVEVCFWSFVCLLYSMLTHYQQIDFGEETGPRTVVSGLVHYIPIEQMRDKYLIAVVGLFFHLPQSHNLVQSETGQHARRQKFCHGSLCMQTTL